MHCGEKNDWDIQSQMSKEVIKEAAISKSYADCILRVYVKDLILYAWLFNVF